MQRILAPLKQHRLPILTMVGFFSLWETACRLHWVNPVLLSPPTDIFLAGIRLSQTTVFYQDIIFTLSVYVLSLVCAVVGGTLIGLAMGYSMTLYQVLNPFIVVINSLPKIVLMPLIMLWMGIGASANLLLGALMAGFPIIVNTYTGIRQLEKEYLQLARSFNAKPVFVLRNIVLPGIAAYILSGLRVGINYAMVGILIAEFFASSQGIGYRMIVLMANFEIDAFFVCLVVVSVITMTGTSLVHKLERKVLVWRPQSMPMARL